MIKMLIIYNKVKNIYIRVKPSGEVVVSCNESIDNKTIELEMIKRANWLLDTIDKYKTNLIEFVDSNLSLVDGEAFLILGKVLRIKNIESNQFKIDYDNNYLYIYRPNQRGIKMKFNQWYLNFVTSQFNDMVNKAYKKFEK